jgi:polyribonucleotide nucleotidyltransferase
MFLNVPISKEINFHGQSLRLETGLLAQQASSSVLASIGETTVMANVVIGSEAPMDYFPLQVIYEEKLYASGKIKGSRFIKREGRPTENAILTGRMVDRSLRSLFDSKTRNEIQVIITVLSVDEINPPDTLAVLAASSAVCLATKDFAGPTSSVRIGLGQTPIKRIVLEKLQQATYAAQTFAEVKEMVIEACRVYDVNNPEDQEYIRLVAKALAQKDADWARFFSDLYKQTDRYTESEIKTKYQSQKTLLTNPSYQEQQQSDIDLVVSGNGQNIVMVEAGADIVTEEVVGNCLDQATLELQTLTNFQTEFIQACQQAGLSKSIELTTVKPETKYLTYWEQYREDLEKASYDHTDKDSRRQQMEQFKSRHQQTSEFLAEFINNSDFSNLDTIRAELVKLTEDPKHPETSGPKDYPEITLSMLQNQLDLLEDSSLSEVSNIWKNLLKAFDNAVKDMVHEKILEEERRIDGRKLDEVRPITCQIDTLPRVHGSSLFQRGETQVLNILTLGSLRDAQTMDDMEDFEETTKRYMHHYNFPSYSVGETGRYGAPGRREIGHGALAEKALLPVIPSEEEFPYTMRLVSECLGSNGSTSMASTCASCLSLLTGGVPLKAMVAGIAMGLVLDQNTGKFKVLTDIQGAEDHHGDMDFKVTGTESGVTAIQLDNKVAGLTTEILKQALVEAKQGRLYILQKMKEVIKEPKPELSQYAPSVLQIDVPVEKIGEVIGPSGKIIKGITAKYEVEIDIADDTGKTYIYAKRGDLAEKARKAIASIIREYKQGDTVEVEIYRIENYGAFAKILEDGQETSKEGLIHISNLKKERVEKVQDVVNIGDLVTAHVKEINDKGQINLSLVS